MALHSEDLHKQSVEAQQEEYDKLHSGPNDSIPDPEAGKGNHLTPEELDQSGDHAKVHLESDEDKHAAAKKADEKK